MFVVEHCSIQLNLATFDKLTFVETLRLVSGWSLLERLTAPISGSRHRFKPCDVWALAHVTGGLRTSKSQLKIMFYGLLSVLLRFLDKKVNLSGHVFH